jgi:hypothetical protein
MKTLDTIPEVVKIAMVSTVTDIGQLSKQQVRDLNKFVALGVLIKGKGGPYPKEKTVYALIGHDIKANRERMVKEILLIN